MARAGFATRAALVWLALVATAVRLHAQEAAGPLSPPALLVDEFRELKARVQRLEQRNDELSRALQDKNKPPDILPTAPTLGDVDPVIAPPVPAAPAANPPKAAAATPPASTWKMDWKDGLRFSKGDDFKFHVGGAGWFDAGWNGVSENVQFGPGGTGDFQDGAVIRRGRVRMDGTMYKNVDWVAEYDFANTILNDDEVNPEPIGTTRFVQVSATLREIPLIGNLRAGYFTEPMGFSSNQQFMERAPGMDSLYLNAPGAMVFNNNEAQTVTWAAGVFHDTSNSFGFGVGDGKLDETGRITWLPWYEDEGRELLHVGVGGAHRHPDREVIQLRGRPSVRTMPATLLPSLASTGPIGTDDWDVLNAEAAAVYGPWTIQSQYYCAFVNDAISPNAPPPNGVPRGTLFYQGTYVEMLYFLTGESLPYNRKQGNFDRVTPRHNFDWSACGWGAWQVGVRYAYLDLQNKDVPGATLNDMVFGLNWYLNPNTRVQCNLAIDHRSATPPDSNGWTYIFGTRLAFDF